MSNSYTEGILCSLSRFYEGWRGVAIESLFSNNENKGYLSFNISEDKEEIEIPILAFPSLASKYSNNDNFSLYSNYVLELKPSREESRTSVDSAIKNMFSPYSNIITMKIKDNTYYGGKGLILNSDGIPLLNINLRCKFNTDNSMSPLDNTISPLLLLGHNIHINPLVFIDDKDPVCRNIVRKLIPIFLQNSLRDETRYFYCYHKLIGGHLYYTQEGSNNIILIDDMKELIKHVPHKDIIRYDSININDDINSVLEKCKDNILYNISLELR